MSDTGSSFGKGWSEMNHTQRAEFVSHLNQPDGALDNAIGKRDERWSRTGRNPVADEQPRPNDPEPAFSVPPHWKRLDVAAVHDWECAPLKPIVADIIAQGNFVFVAAQSQTGKTLWGLNLARNILQGKALFGKYTITPVQKVAYLLLEDPDRRAQDRIIDNEPEFPQPLDAERFIIHIAPSFTLLDDRMFEWLENVIVSEKREVVFLDTYQKGTPGLNSFDDEKQGVILHKLANLTRRLNVTLIVLDHFRKGNSNGKGKRGGSEVTIDDLKGTGGKAQNADCVILMERSADRKQIKFQAFSKDFDTPVRILLNVAPKGSVGPKFSYTADLDQLGQDSRQRGTATRLRILESMKPGDWMGASEVAAAVKMADSGVRAHLKALIDAGKLDSSGIGKWKRYCRIASSIAESQPTNLAI